MALRSSILTEFDTRVIEKVNEVKQSLEFRRAWIRDILELTEEEVRKYDPVSAFRGIFGKCGRGKSICPVCGHEARLCPVNARIFDYNTQDVVNICNGCRRDFMTRVDIDLRSRHLSNLSKRERTFSMIERRLTDKNKKFLRWLVISGIEKGPINIIGDVFVTRLLWTQVRKLKSRLDELKLILSNPAQIYVEVIGGELESVVKFMIDEFGGDLFEGQ